MKFGFIGFGNHALKLLKIIKSKLDNVEFLLYHHREDYKNLDGFQNVFTLGELLNCDAVFICSPNNTHFGYLKYLIENFKGYIFCEKPPVTEPEGLEFLTKIDDEMKKRIYFDFNYRFSPYFESLKHDSEKYSLGNLVNATIIQGHGLGFKDSYGTNWRSKKELHKGGVLETYAVHWFDMFIYLFGCPKKSMNFTASLSPYGDSIDNSNFVCQFDNDATLNLTVSYTMPKMSKMILTFTNGIIEFDEKKIIRAPRDYFDEDGLFEKPPVVFEKSLSKKIQDETLESSIEYFCSAILNKTDFEIRAFDASIETNRLLF